MSVLENHFSYSAKNYFVETFLENLPHAKKLLKQLFFSKKKIFLVKKFSLFFLKGKKASAFENKFTLRFFNIAYELFII
jgi:hypothetical protein